MSPLKKKKNLRRRKEKRGEGTSLEEKRARKPKKGFQ